MTADKRPTSAIIANSKNIRAVLDCHPFFDAATDLNPNPQVGSFWIVSYLDDDEHKFTVLFHLMLIDNGLGRPLAQLAISVFNENTKDYFSKETNQFWLDKTVVALKGLDISTPAGRLSGTIDQLDIEGHISEGSKDFQMKLEMKPRGPVLPNLLTCVIPFADGVNYEYALPRMETSGKISVCGKPYTVKGWSWLDREWGALGPSKWTWMNIQLENDVQMSVWDEQTNNTIPNSYVGGPRRFATILNSNGELVVAPVAIKELAFWTSTKTHQTYAKQWKVTIPGRADLEVELLYDEQEIVSEVGVNRVEGKARVAGTYENLKTSGTTMVELFNLFPLFQK
jgi:Lipocalin-like domain/CrtC N-terminal lipocalin domain